MKLIIAALKSILKLVKLANFIYFCIPTENCTAIEKVINFPGVIYRYAIYWSRGPYWQAELRRPKDVFETETKYFPARTDLYSKQHICIFCALQQFHGSELARFEVSRVCYFIANMTVSDS